jgi:hypothetical protein
MKRKDQEALDKLRIAASDVAWLIDRWYDWRARADEHASGIRSGLGGVAVSGGTHSDPTLAAVLRPDHVDEIDRDMTDTLAELGTKVAKVRLHVERTIEPNKAHRPRGEVRYCRTESCDTVIETSQSEYALGEYCPPCHRWLAENPTEKKVPRHVTANRERMRAERGRVDA